MPLDRAVGVVGPAVIDAVELPGVAPRARGRTMAAAVAAEDVEQARGPGPAGSRQKITGRLGDAAGDEVAGIFDLRRMADIDPAFVEDGAVSRLPGCRGRRTRCGGPRRSDSQGPRRRGLPLPLGMAHFLPGLSSIWGSSEGRARRRRMWVVFSISTAARRPPPPDVPARPRCSPVRNAGWRAPPRTVALPQRPSCTGLAAGADR